MTEWKKCRLAVIFVMLVCLIGMLGTTALCMWEYRRSAFMHLSSFCAGMVQECPEAEEQVIAYMKRYHDALRYGVREEKTAEENGDFLKRYGYRVEEFGKRIPGGLAFAFAAAILVAACGFGFILWYPYRYEKTRIAELTAYLEQINMGGAGAHLVTGEDAFSHLQDEMYKTVTQLYRTREEAVAAKKNFADNLANIAHQLKTPITAAGLSLRLMEKNAGDRQSANGRNTEQREKNEKENENDMRNNVGKYMERIGIQLDRLTDLEESLLTLSKIDAGVLELARTPVDIYTVLNLAADNLEELLMQKEVSVSIPDAGGAEFKGDMEWTMEAVMNLLKNCLEHSPQGAVIHCSYEANPLYAQICIWDEGEGFAQEDLPHLFERFYCGRAGAGASGREAVRGEAAALGQGTGIGLFLTREIFELQNGTVTARNLPEGGACFEIRIYSH